MMSCEASGFSVILEVCQRVLFSELCMPHHPFNNFLLLLISHQSPRRGASLEIMKFSAGCFEVLISTLFQTVKSERKCENGVGLLLWLHFGLFLVEAFC